MTEIKFKDIEVGKTFMFYYKNILSNGNEFISFLATKINNNGEEYNTIILEGNSPLNDGHIFYFPIFNLDGDTQCFIGG